MRVAAENRATNQKISSICPLAAGFCPARLLPEGNLLYPKAMSYRRLRILKSQPYLFLLFSASLAFGSESGSFERTFKVSGPVTLDVRSDPGGLTITRGPSPAVHVRAVIKPLYGRLDFDLAEANIRALEQNPPLQQLGNTIRIGYPDDRALLRAVTIHFDIETPGTTSVRAYTRSGAIQIDGIAGPVASKTASGRTEISAVSSEIDANGNSGAIVIRNAGARVSVRTTSGGIDLSDVKGSVVAETTSGRTAMSRVDGEIRTTTHSGTISIDDAKSAVVAHNHSGRIDALQLGGSIHAETKSGAIRISQLSPAPIRALADSGTIKVTLASGAGYRIDAQSHSGKISASPTIAARPSADAHTLEAQLGAGGPLVDLDTHSSKIEIN
jgi:hypothetical protein